MARYPIMLYARTPADANDLTPEQQEEHARYGQEIGEMGGPMYFPQALQPSTMATSIRGDLVTDGPFIEAKEVIAGFYVPKAQDLDHALAIAKRCSINWQGRGVEVRPIFSGDME